MIRDTALTKILDNAKAGMVMASDRQAELNVITYAAKAIEQYGDDGSDVLGDLSNYAIEVRGIPPDLVQEAIVRGINAALDEKAEAQKTVLPTTTPPKPAIKPLAERLQTAKALKTKTFEPLRFVLPGIVPEGCTLLVSRPKLGKSWLVLDLAIATAAGRYTLGDLKPTQGAVLYLALEDSDRRLQRRMDKILLGEWPAALEFATEWSRADQGGLEDIEAWLKSRPDARLVIIDTLAHFRPATGKSGYLDDYAALAPLQALAGKYGVAVIVVHHDRKMEADDVFDTISGTLGLSGAVDTMLVMKRQAGNVSLYVRGRDIEEAEKAIQFSKDTCRWTVIGEAAEINRSAQRGRVMDALGRANGEGITPAELASEIDITRENAKKVLRRMAESGDIERLGNGKYRSVSPLSPRTVPAGNERNISDLGGDSDTGDTGDSTPMISRKLH